jgi:hypothetical protein
LSNGICFGVLGVGGITSLNGNVRVDVAIVGRGRKSKNPPAGGAEGAGRREEVRLPYISRRKLAMIERCTNMTLARVGQCGNPQLDNSMWVKPADGCCERYPDKHNDRKYSTTRSASSQAVATRL